LIGHLIKHDKWSAVPIANVLVILTHATPERQINASSSIPNPFCHCADEIAPSPQTLSGVERIRGQGATGGERHVR
jgi:hypothetical protein